eukprot:m.149231 g.149231  ORF g.149231 m.149231 type:complete len:336 (+) comp9728_c1_seq4:456-1463(+)
MQRISQFTDAAFRCAESFVRADDNGLFDQSGVVRSRQKPCQLKRPEANRGSGTLADISPVGRRVMSVFQVILTWRRVRAGPDVARKRVKYRAHAARVPPLDERRVRAREHVDKRPDSITKVGHLHVVQIRLGALVLALLPLPRRNEVQHNLPELGIVTAQHRVVQRVHDRALDAAQPPTDRERVPVVDDTETEGDAIDGTALEFSHNLLEGLHQLARAVPAHHCACLGDAQQARPGWHGARRRQQADEGVHVLAFHDVTVDRRDAPWVVCALKTAGSERGLQDARGSPRQRTHPSQRASSAAFIARMCRQKSARSCSASRRRTARISQPAVVNSI